MDLKYARLHASKRLLVPFSSYMRSHRNNLFISAMRLQGGERVIDLGGTVEFWDSVLVPLNLTVLNLPGEPHDYSKSSHHNVSCVEGDACKITNYSDQSFDIVFSNSVIEHVGGPEKQRMMAREVRRLAPRYWVQTPSIWFPIEAHTYMPFWWFYPEPVKAYFMRSWFRKLPEWTEMIQGTSVLSHREMRELFPEAKIMTEHLIGITKSYIAVRA
ncbi:class I SAM-dependent methyltransferase [Rubellimicrobium rubrum]|uniref:Class I SAM-dependent methyltransferase n=1 Tax=Rubellimicrobium rubrum TaxID=2585369 RepID=A0A5C4MIC4_9RHOB|nr:class I SAM-dependent methyltransferase [Rubellimicrobium rubrum]TNC44694.1 class I SAM-dependent methyltransferase [Rubellimicrobium rubrum]